jgi:tripartite-type tricarboxylate transporter receptor subunit TctC
MKRLVLLACLLQVVYGDGLTVSPAQAQSYPNRPIQLIVPAVPGATSDITGRLLAEEMERILGGRVVVINKPGGSMTLGTDTVARSRKDGYTLLYAPSAATVHARITNPETVSYDSDKDLEPLGVHCFFPLVISVQEGSPWKSFAELIEHAKKNPGQLRVSTPGVGSLANFNIEIIKAMTGAQFTLVPFKGGESVVTALLGGHVEVTCDMLAKFIPHVEAGKLRILMLSKKVSEFPHIPTITELGYKQDLLSGWFALYAPAGIPEDVKKVLVTTIEKAIKNPEIKAKVEKMQYVVDYKSPGELKKLMAEEYEVASNIAARIGLGKQK